MNITVNFNVAQTFWLKFGEMLQDEIRKSSAAIQQMLEEDYPNILKYFYEMTNKLKYDEYSFKYKKTFE